MNTLAVIGAGNLARSVVPALKSSGIIITTIYSRTYAHAVDLSREVDARPVRSLSEIGKAGFYLLSVPDDSIIEVSTQLREQVTADSVAIHTSGSSGIDILRPYFSRYGAFYPFQTFSASRPVRDLSSIPIYIEADSESTLSRLRDLAGGVSERVSVLNSDSRMGLHIAGVFSSNFVNAMLSSSFEICREFAIDPNDLRLLVESTVSKAFESGNPERVQTGPAVREDMQTVARHLSFLHANLPLERVYSTVTEYIINKKKHK
jgi:predicted short-subunit dehydrogenase-like oxidoreductase (DUF2520 family)